MRVRLALSLKSICYRPTQLVPSSSFRIAPGFITNWVENLKVIDHFFGSPVGIAKLCKLGTNWAWIAPPRSTQFA